LRRFIQIKHIYLCISFSWYPI